MVNLYTVYGVPSLTEIEVRPHHHTFQVYADDVVFVQELPVATVEAASNEDRGWLVTLDRQVKNILIGSLIGIGRP
jgi:carotenoid cleavage dioxygenase-like enzyme